MNVDETKRPESSAVPNAGHLPVNERSCFWGSVQVCGLPSALLLQQGMAGNHTITGF